MRKWRGREKMEGERENGEMERDISSLFMSSLSPCCISISSFSRNFLSLSSHSLAISLSISISLFSLILSPFSLSLHFLFFFPCSHSLAIFSLYISSLSLHFLILSLFFLSPSPFTNFFSPFPLLILISFNFQTKLC